MNILSQKEIDNLLGALCEPEDTNYKNDFAVELLKDKIRYYEDKKQDLLTIIENEYNPYIASLNHALSLLDKHNTQ